MFSLGFVTIDFRYLNIDLLISLLDQECYLDRVSYSLPSATYRPSFNVETSEGQILQGDFSASKSIKESSATKLYTSVPGEIVGVSLEISQRQYIGNM